jgi:hypothetical protein
MNDEGTSATPAARTCPWCATVAAPEATTCGSCGAALAQHESLGDVRIPGLTSVDPALEDFDKRPMHLRGPSSSQGVAPALIVGAAAGGPIGAMLIGGVVAVAAAEYLGAKQAGTGGAALDAVGTPSELALRAAEKARADAARVEAGGDAPVASAESDPGEADAAASGGGEAESDAAATDGGMSIWRDLPTQS